MRLAPSFKTLPHVFLLACMVFSAVCAAQAPPSTPGETLTGQKLILAEAMRAHPSVLIASFSKDAATTAGQWDKAVRDDAAMAGVSIYDAAMIEHAPGFIRGMVKSALRKQVPPPVQPNFVVLTQDDSQWRSYFGVTTENDPYVILLDASGQVRWRGHGTAHDLEAQLRAAFR